MTYEERDIQPGLMRITDGWRVKIDDIPGRIDHRRLINFRVTKAGETTQHNYYVRYVKEWRLWNGLSSPVLYRIDGGPSSFGLSDFSPSIAAGPRWYYGSGRTKYIGLNAMLTIFTSSDKDDADRPFSMGVGLIADAGGIFQLGGNYQFKDKKAYIVMGIRPEIWSIGNAKGSD
ncbi:MAG: hypothetical protein ACI906_004951 [Candidatus Latescibacterota bacterium]|jgi:hypothetical protein